MFRLPLFLLAAIAVSFAQDPVTAADLAGTSGDPVAAILPWAQTLGPYGTIIALLIFSNRFKVPAVPLRLEGPVTVKLDGPVELAGHLSCGDHESSSFNHGHGRGPVREALRGTALALKKDDT